MIPADKASQAIELLAPAKNADIGIEAILHGADAVYIGGPGFGARVEAANAFADIKRLTNFAHRFNARVYMTLNTIVNDEERLRAVELAHLAYENGVDALIVQDMGILDSDLPPIQLHASTQCDVRTPEKARFLESVGFSQVVLAREMDLAQIRRCYETLQSARIEYFIHGALCVSYSGQCYASFAATGRSANRGACAQLCRLPYSVYTEDGRELIADRHVLSLKDNNQTANLEALIDAGVRSFKIEGRLKDASYVKNITAHYRQAIDAILARRKQWGRTSDGQSVISFTPNPQKSFNRGFTDYFTRERHHDMAVFETPKNTGEKIGKILRITDQTIEVQSKAVLNNADGLTYLTREKNLMGFAVNRATEIEPGRWSLTLRDRPILKKHPQLAPGIVLYRNRDQAWEEKLSKPTARRVISAQAKWNADSDGFNLELTDERGYRVSVHSTIENLQKTSNADKNRQNIEKNLRKTGDTDFEINHISITGEDYFAPASVVNQMRRLALGNLAHERKTRFEKLKRPCVTELLTYPDATDFRANVLNEQAVVFYKKHGAAITEGALETGQIHREVPLMVTKHCVRFALGLCLKDNIEKVKADPALKARFRPDSLILKSGPNTYRTTFDCKKCEMTLMGKVKTNTSLGEINLKKN